MAGLMVATTGHRINAIRNLMVEEVESAVKTSAGYTIYVSTDILLSNGGSIAGLSAIKILILKVCASIFTGFLCLKGSGQSHNFISFIDQGAQDTGDFRGCEGGPEGQ